MTKDNKNKTNVPNLRFPGFEGEWEKKKLGEKCEINPKNPNLPNSFIYIDLESVVNGILLKEERIFKSESPSRAQRLLKNNDILFQMVRPYQKNNLFFDKNGDYVASTGYAQIRTEQNPQFIFQYLHNQKFVNEVIEKCTGTSYPAINSTDLSNIDIHIPSIKEQSKIAEFLSLYDERIQQSSKIIEELKSLKKTLCRKIFSREFKFKNEDGIHFADWEEKKLERIGSFFSGGTPLTTKKEFFNGEIPFIRSGEINSEKTEQFITELGLKNSSAKMVEIGDLIYALYGATSGEVAVSKIKGAINQAILCIRTNEVNRFLYYYLWLNKKNIINTYLQGGQGNLSADIIKSIIVPIPSIEEQTKIANFLSAIDNKIETEKKILEQYKNQKAYLLQNMFI